MKRPELIRAITTIGAIKIMINLFNKKPFTRNMVVAKLNKYNVPHQNGTMIDNYIRQLLKQSRVEKHGRQWIAPKYIYPSAQDKHIQETFNKVVLKGDRGFMQTENISFRASEAISGSLKKLIKAELIIFRNGRYYEQEN